MPGALGGQKRVLEALELELPTIIGLSVGAENLTWVLRKSSYCS